MKIIEITENNFETFKDDLVELNDNLLKELNIFKERTDQQKEEILRNMIRHNSPTHLLIGLDDQNKTVGMTYFNEGTGYSCGGDYLWMNSIYIRPEEQQKGYGSSLLNYVETKEDSNYSLVQETLTMKSRINFSIKVALNNQTMYLLIRFWEIKELGSVSGKTCCNNWKIKHHLTRNIT